jgi:hypothetical protein
MLHAVMSPDARERCESLAPRSSQDRVCMALASACQCHSNIVLQL